MRGGVRISGDTAACGWHWPPRGWRGCALRRAAALVCPRVGSAGALVFDMSDAATVSGTQVNLSWSPSTDTGGCGVAGYRVYRDNKLIATTPLTNFSDTTAAPNTKYRYRLSAHDSLGNRSTRSGQTQVKTP